MIAANIISGILQRYKQICAKYPQSPSFIPNTNGDSFYLVRERDGNRPVQVRISNHGTYLSKWCDREELGNSVERLDPALCDNISIAFIDDGNDITKDCKGRQDCEDCNIQPCIPQTFDGQNELGKPFKVIQYTYKSSQISPRYINGLTKAIAEASVSGKYNDPLANLVKAAKKKPLSSSENNQEIKENKNNKYKKMNKKQVIRINENQLKQIIMESVKNVIKETKFQRGYYNITDDMSFRDIQDRMRYFGIEGGRMAEPNYLPKQWIKKRLRPKDTEYVYNVENLIDKPNIVSVLDTGTDTFFGVDKDGNIYGNGNPDECIGNLNTDKIYGTGCFGDYCWLIVYKDEKQALFDYRGIICYGKVIQLDNGTYFFATKQRT